MAGAVLAGPATGLCTGLDRASSFEFGAGVSHFEYKEPGLMTEKGPFVELYLAYTHPRPDEGAVEGLWFRAEFMAGFGQVDYDGHLMDGTPYSFTGTDSMRIEPRLLLGRAVDYAGVRVSPYVGIGYRRLDNAQSGDPAGYDRLSQYLYSPIGLQTRASLKGSWRIGGTLEYDLFWIGRQESGLVDPPIQNDQRSGYGLRASIQFTRRQDASELVFEPYVVYWDIRTSEVEYGPDHTGYVEPANHCTEVGLRVRIRF
ncbi:MAG: hypothetical protein KBE04_08525 [Phycisphaerae bacterium]|nr:hypothetical protein [Phycisphaerae bacterium]